LLDELLSLAIVLVIDCRLPLLYPSKFIGVSFDPNSQQICS